MHRNDALTLAQSALDSGRLFADLRRRVALRTESDGGSVPPALTAYLTDELRPSLEALGFDCRLCPNPDPKGGPFLIARRIEDPALPTLLSYGHGDVVSGQDAQWREGLAPWTLVAEGERWYGRGTSDNKGQHSIALAALEAVLQARGGRLGFNMTWLFETGEEAASPGLAAVCAAERAALAADLFIASDGPRVGTRQPTLFLGSRGAVNFTLRIRSGRTRGYHSGNWGGVLGNPATRIAHAVGTLADARGRLLVEALRPPPVDDAVRRALADIPIGAEPDDPPLDADWGEPGLLPAERLVAWNTFEVLALEAGNPQRPINAIPHQAAAHCQLRFVVGTDWERTAEHVQAHLAAHGFEDVEVQVTLAGAATRLDLRNPWVEWAVGSITRSAGHAPHLLPNLAGSLPNDIFATQLGLPTLWVPHGHAGCAQHAPNEHLLVPLVREGLAVMAGLYWDLGEPGAAPWPDRAMG